jgi:histidyl-tRNA synthetase
MNCKYVLVIGEDEVNSNKANIKNMATGEETSISLSIENIIKIIHN